MWSHHLGLHKTNGKGDSITTQCSVLAKPYPASSQYFLCNMGWGATLKKKNPHNSLMSHWAELFTLTLRDASPIPLLFLSWYPIFDLHRWQLLPCLSISRKHWDNLSLQPFSAKGYKKTSRVHSHNLAFCCFYHRMLGHMHSTPWKSGHHFSIASECGRKRLQALGNRLQFSCNQKAK